MPTLWIATRKGAFQLSSDRTRKHWALKGPQLLGHIVHHVVQDPRQRKVLVLAPKTGHLGSTVCRSIDRGRTWLEAMQPPAFGKAAAGNDVAAVLADLDRRFPGMRFRMIDEQGRIRQHIRIFVNTQPALTLNAPLRRTPRCT